MSDRIVVSIVDGRFFAQYARPSDTDTVYAENAAIAVDLMRRGENRVQVDDVDEAKEVKRLLRDKRVIV